MEDLSGALESQLLLDAIEKEETVKYRINHQSLMLLPQLCSFS